MAGEVTQARNTCPFLSTDAEMEEGKQSSVRAEGRVSGVWSEGGGKGQEAEEGPAEPDGRCLLWGTKREEG